MIVTAGDHSIFAIEDQEQMRNVSRMVTHPGYNGGFKAKSTLKVALILHTWNFKVFL